MHFPQILSVFPHKTLWICCCHFTDEETGSERLVNLPKVIIGMTKLLCGRPRTQTQTLDYNSFVHSRISQSFLPAAVASFIFFLSSLRNGTLQRKQEQTGVEVSYGLW